MILGIGLCDLAADKVVELCQWEVKQADNTLTFRTEQAMQGWALPLERTVTLVDRTVRSWTRVTNTGHAFLPIR